MLAGCKPILQAYLSALYALTHARLGVLRQRTIVALLTPNISPNDVALSLRPYLFNNNSALNVFIILPR